MVGNLTRKQITLFAIGYCLIFFSIAPWAWIVLWFHANDNWTLVWAPIALVALVALAVGQVRVEMANAADVADRRFGRILADPNRGHAYWDDL